MAQFIHNRITVVGSKADLQVIVGELSTAAGCEDVEILGSRVTCCGYTLGTPAHDTLADLSQRYPRLTIGNLWWTEDAEAHGITIWVVGTTEFEWWGEGMELVDEDDYSCWEDAVAAEANLRHGRLLETLLAAAEIRVSRAG